MDLLIAFCIFIGSLIVCLVQDLSMLIPLAIGLLSFIGVGLYRGFTLKTLGKMSLDGAKSSFVVLRVFLLIGMITALWRAGGVIPFFVYHGIEIITPSLFLLVAFLLTSLLAYALGTSFGIIGTAGVILMTLARAGGVSEILTAGAVMSGAYFGDRNAPTASSAHLVAAVTGTKLFDNVKLMFKSGALPYLLSLGVYAFFSVRNPLHTVDSALLQQITDLFHLSWWLLLPAVLMLLLPLCKVEVRTAMMISIVAAFILTVAVQGHGIWETVKICVLGYHPEGEGFAQIVAGGGLISMVEVAGIVLLSCTYSGVFKGTGMLNKVEDKIVQLGEKIGLFPTAIVVGTLANGIFCNQTIGVVMSNQLLSKAYQHQGVTPSELAIDMENSVIVIAGLVPWCIACAVPLGMLGVSSAAIPYSVFLYAVPLCYLFTKRFFFRKDKKKA